MRNPTDAVFLEGVPNRSIRRTGRRPRSVEANGLDYELLLHPLEAREEVAPSGITHLTFAR